MTSTSHHLDGFDNAADTVLLPNRPLVTIVPSRGWVALNLPGLWEYRELLYFLVWRDMKVRYKQTALGAAWAVLQPLLTMLIFTLLFGKVAKLPSDGIPYPIFAYAGLLPWVFFANAITNSSNSLVSNANLITKVYFPRIIVPGASVIAGLLDFAIAFVIVVVLMVVYRVSPTWNLVMLPSLVVLTTALATGVGMLLSALNVKYRDIRYALPFVTQLWMFATPIIYSPSMIPEAWRWILFFNPMAGIIEGFRASICGTVINWQAFAVSTCWTAVLLIYSSYFFRRMERNFADLI